MRVDVVDEAKDWTAASQTLSRSWDPRDAWSGSNRKDALPGPESSGESDPEARPDSPSTETVSEEESGSGSSGTGSNSYDSGSMPSGAASSTGSPHASPPPGWGGEMASHDAIADGDQLALPPSPPNGWDHASMPQSDDPPLRTLVSSYSSSSSDIDIEGYSSDPSSLGLTGSGSTSSQSTGSGSTGSKSTGSGSTSSGSTSSKSTDSGSTSSESTDSDSASSGSTGSDDPKYGTFIRKLVSGEIEARTSGSRTVNATQRNTLD